MFWFWLFFTIWFVIAVGMSIGAVVLMTGSFDEIVCGIILAILAIALFSATFYNFEIFTQEDSYETKELTALVQTEDGDYIVQTTDGQYYNLDEYEVDLTIDATFAGLVIVHTISSHPRWVWQSESVDNLKIESIKLEVVIDGQ